MVHKWGKIDWSNVSQRRQYRRQAFKEYKKKYPNRVKNSQRKYRMKHPHPPRQISLYCNCGNFIDNVKHLRHKHVCRECYNKQYKEYQSKPENQIKINAEHEFRSYVIKGFIEQENCQICGKKAQSHHPDYTKPLQVIWLCPSHHGKVHHGHKYDLEIIDYEEIKRLAYQEKMKEIAISKTILYH